MTGSATSPGTEKAVQGCVFNIQRYSTHDGPGIRTVVFLKGCSLRCFWCQNPESQRGQPEVLFDPGKCTRCGECVQVCPHGAAYLKEDSSGIRRDLCQGCGKCAQACPNGARQLMGRLMSVEEVLSQVRKDIRFYENSGGGVTLSGGDPLAQPEFAAELLRRCKQLGLHTAMETCGFVRWSVVESVLPLVDLAFYDIKHMDSQKHREATGARNDLILENARSVAQRVTTIIRVPLIPGFNDSVEDIRAIVRFVREHLGGVRVELLPYNKMGEIKYNRLDRAGPHLETQNDARVQELEALVCGTLTLSPREDLPVLGPTN